MIYPLLPGFLSDVLHAPRTFIGAVEGAAEATASLLKLVSGRLADRMHRRKPLTVFGYGISSAIRPLIGLALQPWHVLLARVGDRVGKGLRSSPRDALIADGTPPGERGRAYGFHQAMDNAGALIGPLVATALLALGLTLRNVFLLAAIPGAMAMAALIGGVREPARPAKPAAQDASPAHISPANISHTRSSLTRYLVAVSLFALGNSSDAFLLLRAQQCGVVLALIPMLWMAHNATKAALSTWAGALSDRLGRRRIIIGGWAVYGLVYLAFGQATRAWHIWGLFILYGLYYALTEGTEKALIADLAPAGARGRAFGWYNGLVGLMALPASLGFGALADRYGAPLAFTVSAGLALVASLWLALLVPVPPPRAPAS
jgi:MFS family permease